MSQNQRPTWAEISIPALVYNFHRLRRHLDPGVKLMAVVKADAYGHGAIECARALEAEGADWFGVALVEEGCALREAGISRPIFCLGGFFAGQAAEVVENNLTPAVFRWDLAEELNAVGRTVGRVLPVHIKVDTGMGRFGIAAEDTGDFARRLLQLTHLRIEGLLTHFATADDVAKEYALKQIDRYDLAARQLKAIGVEPRWRHLANSAAIHAHSNAWGNLARAGASLYGLERDVFAPEPEPLGLKPVLSLHSRIAFLKDVGGGTPLGYGRMFTTTRRSVIATLPIGYADGLRRAHTNNGKVIVKGNFAPIVGRISMDLTVIDVTDVPDVGLGDEVILIGSQGDLEIKAEDLAEEIETISYEVVCGVSRRVPRLFLPIT